MKKTTHYIKTRYRKRLAKLAISLLSGRVITDRGERLLPPSGRELIFRMITFGATAGDVFPSPAQVHTCGTSCCLLGYAPLIFPVTRKLREWSDVSKWVLGEELGTLVVATPDPLWDFLFGGWWSNDAKLAACRVLYALGLPKVLKAELPQDAKARPLVRLMKCSEPEILAALAKHA